MSIATVKSRGTILRQMNLTPHYIVLETDSTGQPVKKLAITELGDWHVVNTEPITDEDGNQIGRRHEVTDIDSTEVLALIRDALLSGRNLSFARW